MQVRPVALTQLLSGRDGRSFEVSSEAGRIAQRLHEIDASVRVSVSEQGFFVIYQLLNAAGVAVADEADSVKEGIIARVPWDKWDDRVIRDFEQRFYELRNGISPIARLDAHDAAVKRARDHEFEELVGEKSYNLFRALQRDLGTQPRVYLSGRKAA